MTREEKVKIVKEMTIDVLLQQLYQSGENAGKHPLFSEGYLEHQENAKLLKEEILARFKKEVTA